MPRNNRNHDNPKSAYRKKLEQSDDQRSQVGEDDRSIEEILGVDMSYSEIIDLRLEQRRKEIREKYTRQK